MCVRRKRIVVGGVVECWRTRQCGIEVGGVTVRVRGFGELEAVVMDRIWNRDGTTTVREIFDELTAEREIAYTTVMSTMDNLHTKGWLARERDGKAYRYWPALTREQHSAQLMREALDGGGRSDLVLSHFLEQISPEESARLRQALQRLARRARRK
jgi:predicted transcriptional regulator